MDVSGNEVHMFFFLGGKYIFCRFPSVRVTDQFSVSTRFKGTSILPLDDLQLCLDDTIVKGEFKWMYFWSFWDV